MYLQLLLITLIIHSVPPGHVLGHWPALNTTSPSLPNGVVNCLIRLLYVYKMPSPGLGEQGTNATYVGEQEQFLGTGNIENENLNFLGTGEQREGFRRYMTRFGGQTPSLSVGQHSCHYFPYIS